MALSPLTYYKYITQHQVLHKESLESYTRQKGRDAAAIEGKSKAKGCQDGTREEVQYRLTSRTREPAYFLIWDFKSPAVGTPCPFLVRQFLLLASKNTKCHPRSSQITPESHQGHWNGKSF
jgi:hypothetical protein